MEDFADFGLVQGSDDSVKRVVVKVVKQLAERGYRFRHKVGRQPGGELRLEPVHWRVEQISNPDRVRHD